VTSGKCRVLVTGAAGFIGRPLVAALDGAGYAVRAAVRDRRGQSFPPGVEVAALPDLAAPIDWSALVGGMDAVVHLAGIAHVVDDDQLLLITEQGMIIRVSVTDLRSMGRSTQGVRVINVEENDRVVAAVKVVEKEENGGPTQNFDESIVH